MKIAQSVKAFRKLPGVRKFSVVILLCIPGIFVVSIIQGMMYNSSSNSQTVNSKVMSYIQQEEGKVKNYRILRRKAIDSLIDNKKLTPENLALIRERYPDSLCDCK